MVAEREALTFDTNTNRISTSGISYDAAGNMTASDGTGVGTHTYQWDAEGRLKSVDSGAARSILYNALGQQVEKLSTTPVRDFHILFDVAGQELGEWNNTPGTQWWDWANVRLGSKLVTAYWANPYFTHQSVLGSTSMVTDYAGAVVEDETQYPWGQEWNHTGSRWDEHYASMMWHDYATGLDPTPFRMYSSQYGRWMSPDPLAGDISNPQSLNRYAYVVNNPTNLVDPLGLCGQHGCYPGRWDDGMYGGGPQDMWGGPSGAVSGFGGHGGSSGTYMGGSEVSAGVFAGVVSMGIATACPNKSCTNIQRVATVRAFSDRGLLAWVAIPRSIQNAN